MLNRISRPLQIIYKAFTLASQHAWPVLLLFNAVGCSFGQMQGQIGQMQGQIAQMQGTDFERVSISVLLANTTHSKDSCRWGFIIPPLDTAPAGAIRSRNIFHAYWQVFLMGGCC